MAEWKRNFNQIDHLMTQDQRFLKLKDPWCKTVLMYLYISPHNRCGLVHESPGDIAETLSMEYEDVVEVLGDLEDAGRIHRDKRQIVLLDWREWMGGHQHKDDDGRLKLTKQIVSAVKLDRPKLNDDVFETWLDTTGYATSDALYGVLDEPDPRGGDRRSDQFRSRSKADQKRTKSFDRVLPYKERETDRDEEEGKQPHPRSVEDVGESLDDSPAKGQKSQPDKGNSAKLTRDIATAYAKAFLSRSRYGLRKGTKAHRRFQEAARKVRNYCERANTFSESDVVDMLIKVVKAQADDQGWDQVNPGNLCSEFIWKDALPQHVKRILGSRGQRTRRRACDDSDEDVFPIRRGKKKRRRQ